MKKDGLDKTKKFWNSMAEQFADFEVPNVENNEFMAFLKEREMLINDGLALDVGCGAGKYSFGIAPYFKNVVGTDISDNMIDAANNRMEKSQTKNISFECVSWQELDLQERNWERKFDLVFAHMTPAVSEMPEIIKMRKASKKWCAITKSVYRDSDIAKKIDEICGGVVKGYGENELNQLLLSLWSEKITPQLFYEGDCWSNSMTVERATETYINRMSVKKELSEREKEEINSYFKSIAVENIVNENTDVIICTVYWKENWEE